MFKSILISLVFSVISFTTFSANALDNRLKPFELKTGTIIIGGFITLDQISHTPDNGDTQSGTLITFAPSGGYFITDNVAVFATFSFMIPTGDLFSAAGKSYALSGGARYFHPISRFYIYGGIEGGWLKATAPEAENSTKRNFKNQGIFAASGSDVSGTLISFPFGILFPINTHLGIDAGIRIQHFVDNDDNSYFGVSFGYFGIQGFF
ncbi:hypothetical protein KKF34_02595 [Myxococcota bacterium]|nr:hypothetical protein [Myxococcota bacterium]MBU1380942.1 hypothetical protein [Myxococcota bacterium]MBU1495751.1 hypothetical protein [Myxococcota bacterium]